MSEKDNIILHPIQITSLDVIELFIKPNKPPNLEDDTNSLPCKFAVGHSEFDKDNQSIAVAVKLEIGMDNEEPVPPFSMKIELMAVFNINIENFPEDKVVDWANRNAPFIIYPYLREHAFSLTARIGFKPMLLPLVELPTLKIELPKKNNN